MPEKEKVTPTRPIVMKHPYSGVVNFSFTKKDGTLREMNATLVTSQIPELNQKQSLPNHPTELDNVVCWDVDINEWRTFKVSTLESYNGIVRLV